MGSPFPGPTAPYSNPPIEPQYFSPSRFVITDVALGPTTTVTVQPNMINGVTTNLNYYIGQLVRLLIPGGYGCTQLNEQTGLVVSLPATNEATVNIDSSMNVNAFIPANTKQSPQIVAVGDINNGFTTFPSINQVSPAVPGAFINISPY